MNAEPNVTRRSVGHAPRVTRRTARGIGVAVAAALLTSACAAGQQAQTADEVPSIDGQNQPVGSIALREVAIQAPPSAGKFYAAGSDALLTFVMVNKGHTDDRLVDVSTDAAGGWSAFADYNDAFAVQQAAGGAAPTGEATGSPIPAPSSTTAGTSDSAAAPSGSESGSGSASGSESGSASGSESGSASSSASASTSSAAPLPTGTKSVRLPAGTRVAFGTPSATGAILLTGLTKKLYPGTTIKIRVTFARAGTATLSVPVQLADIARTAEVGGGDGGEGGEG